MSVLTAKLLLDTNYLIDYADETRPDSASTIALFRAIVKGKFDAVISAASLKDAYYLLAKHLGEQAARDWVRVFIRALSVEPLDVEACAIALESNEPDFEDGCVRAIAERDNVDFIITRDKKAFARSWIKAYSAKEFLELFPVEE